MQSRRPFLTARWRHLAMLNYELDSALLAPSVPAGTELDRHDGRVLVSVVGFLFLDTRVRGLALPGYRDFEEVNLRFYVRRRAAEGWRRAVVFVKEIVPRRAIAWTARALYGENYVRLPMAHRLEGDPDAPRAVRYSWSFRGSEHALELVARDDARSSEPGSEVEFVTEHTWGYTRRRNGRTGEYRVEHPRWNVRMAASARLECDVAALWGERFVEALGGAPSSAFLADGSEVAVHAGTLLPEGVG